VYVFLTLPEMVRRPPSIQTYTLVLKN